MGLESRCISREYFGCQGLDATKYPYNCRIIAIPKVFLRLASSHDLAAPRRFARLSRGRISPKVLECDEKHYSAHVDILSAIRLLFAFALFFKCKLDRGSYSTTSNYSQMKSR